MKNKRRQLSNTASKHEAKNRRKTRRPETAIWGHRSSCICRASANIPHAARVCQSRPKSLEIVLQKTTVGQLRTSLQGGTRKSSAAIRGYGDVARERKQHARLDCRGWPRAVARQAPRPVQPVFRHLPALHAPAVYTLRCFLRLMHTTGSRMSAPRRRSTRSVRGTSAPRSSAGSVTPQCCRAWDPSRPHGNP